MTFLILALLTAAMMTQEIVILKKIETDFLIAKLRSDDIAHIHVKANTLVDLAVQAEMQRIYNELTPVKIPFIFTGDEFVSVTSEARKNSIKMEEHVPLPHSVIVVRNLAQRILAEYYYKFNKPKRPVKIVTKFEDAIGWIYENVKSLPPPSL